MAQEVTASQGNRHLSRTINLCSRCSGACKQLIFKRLAPRSKKYISTGIRTCREKLAPGMQKGSSFIGHEIKKIHGKQNWFKRCGITMIDNAAGLGMAMLAGKIVQSHVEVQQFSNLWGLLATRPVVSESTYEILNFAAEFFIALIVFTLTEHYLDEYRKKKNQSKPEAVAN